MKPLVLLLMLTLGACSVSHTSGNTKTIVYDEGGIIENYDAHVNQLNELGTRVKLMGMHISAGTMYLGVDNVCVHPKASLGFHGSWLNKRGEKPEYDSLMASHYTPELRQWYYKNAAHVQVAWVTLSGQQLHNMFGYELCET